MPQRHGGRRDDALPRRTLALCGRSPRKDLPPENGSGTKGPVHDLLLQMTPTTVDHRDALVRAAASGDRDSFGVLVEGCWNALVRFARSIVGDLEAEDAVQFSDHVFGTLAI